MSRLTPNAARTPSWIWRASASRPAVLAWPGLIRASVCLLEMRAGPGPGRVALAEAGLLDQPGGAAS